MTIDDTVEILDTVLMQEVDGETILLDINSEEYFSLNEIGTMFYKLLQEEPNLSLALSELENHFDVSKEELQKDLLHFVSTLEEKKLLLER